MRIRLGLITLLLMASALPAAAGTYDNARYGYHIDVPAQFSVADPESDSGDGEAFHTADKSADLLAYGGWIIDDFATEARERKGYDKQDGWTISYESKPTPSAVSWSGKKGDRIFYERMITSCKGKAHANYRLEYPAADAAKYNAVVKTLNTALQADKGSCN